MFLATQQLHHSLDEGLQLLPGHIARVGSRASLFDLHTEHKMKYTDPLFEPEQRAE
jgi:hypothetical protein